VSSQRSERLSIEHDHPERRLDEDTLRALVRHVLAEENASLVHLTVVLSGHDTVRALNVSYLDHDYNTDVLSFSLRSPASAFPPEPGTPPDDSAVEGEVYVDLDTAAERHTEFETSFKAEAYRYVVHGVLHLVGYDDATEAAQATMRAREDKYLRALDLRAAS
jgi:rRNA maturation RNase YbeY